MDFDILGSVSDVETIATGRGIRELARLRRVYGQVVGATERESPAFGWLLLAEVHWYEAAGIGRKETKIKHLL